MTLRAYRLVMEPLLRFFVATGSAFVCVIPERYRRSLPIANEAELRGSRDRFRNAGDSYRRARASTLFFGYSRLNPSLSSRSSRGDRMRSLLAVEGFSCF
jgi:hypothetical protein